MSVVRRRPSTSGRRAGSCSSCADRRSRCRAAPSAWRRRLPCSSGTRPPGSPAGWARRRCRTRSSTAPRLRTAPGRTAGRSVPRTPAAPTCATPRSSSRRPRRPCPAEMSWRAFSANSGQFEAGSTTTGSSFLPEHAALGVDLVDRHQRHVLQHRLADRHRARERMQHADLDRVGGRRLRRRPNLPSQARPSMPTA